VILLNAISFFSGNYYFRRVALLIVIKTVLKKENSVLKFYFLFALAILVLAWVSLFTGVKEISYATLLQEPDQLLVFTISRIPRTLSLILSGAGLSIAGLIMQQITQNKFISPTTSGGLEAAKMGILFGLILFPGTSLMAKMLFAIACTFAANLLFLSVIRLVKYKGSVYIPLVGIMFGNILAAVSTFFAYKHEIVQNTQEWLLGDFSAVLAGQYEAIYLILPAVVLAYVYADRFTIAGMGEHFAKNLGLSYTAVVNIGLFVVALVVGATVVTVGTIAFVGLVIPNLVSMYSGDHLKRTLPFSAFAGAIFLLICDIFGRIIIAPYEIPIGMTAGLIGGVFFLILILKKRK